MYETDAFFENDLNVIKNFYMPKVCITEITAVKRNKMYQSMILALSLCDTTEDLDLWFTDFKLELVILKDKDEDSMGPLFGILEEEIETRKQLINLKKECGIW